MVGGTTQCSFVDFEVNKVAEIEEVTEHSAVHSPAVATVEKEGMKTVEKIGRQVDLFLSLSLCF